jgi:uncharacterized membrane protein
MGGERVSTNRIRIAIDALSFAGLIVALIARKSVVSFLVISVCLCAAALILLFHLSALSVSASAGKRETIRTVTVFDIVLFSLAAILVVLIASGRLTLSDDQESALASLIVSAVVLPLGNICPKLPPTRHTGLRLPWTVADGDTWVVAHRILGDTALPVALCNLILACTAMRSVVRNSLSCGSFLAWVALASLLSLAFYIKKIEGRQ